MVYEPKREFYAWLCSLGLTTPVTYFCPSDTRSVSLDFARDYASDLDSKTLAHALYPHDPNEKQRFWGDATRTIFAQVFDALKRRVGLKADLRLVCLVLEDMELTRELLGTDPYLVEARRLVEKSESEKSVGETSRNILHSIDSRISELKVLAAHLALARKENGAFSLRDFVREERAGTLVVSKDADYGLVQDPMNGVLFLRLIQLLDQLGEDTEQNPGRRRKVFIVIDEFPTLAGKKPCPGIEDMFLRLRSRGVAILITYQALTTLKEIYGEHVTATIGQCTNVMYLRQSDMPSAEYAAEDLGRARGREAVIGTSVQSGMSGNMPSSSFSVSKTLEWYDRPVYSATDLKGLPPPSREEGIHGRARSPHVSDMPWPFVYPPEYIDAIPAWDPAIERYIKRDPELRKHKNEDPDKVFEKYQELMRKTQRITPLGPEEIKAIFGRSPTQPECEPWDKCQD